LKRSGGTALPRTYVGRWLRAAVLDRQEERDRLVRSLNGGNAAGWNDDEPAVVEAAAELVLRQYFGPGEADANEVSWLASVACASMPEVGRNLNDRHAGAVIRSALGQPGTDADAPMSSGERFLLRMAITSLASIRMDLDESRVDELLREAERVAFDRGFHPLLRRGASASPPMWTTDMYRGILDGLCMDSRSRKCRMHRLLGFKGAARLLEN
jgi:hypothetical protein